MRRKNLLAVPAALLLLSALGCEYGLPAGDEPHREFNFINMGDQPKLKPQRGDLLGEKPLGLLKPPPGAVAQDDKPYPYTQKQADAAAKVKNPLKPTSEVIAMGKWHFENICIACHGAAAAGDGLVATLFPKPPSLMTKRVRDWSDGRMYHVPMRGQGSMPGHSKQITREALWSVIHYIRSLQKKLPVAPPPDDAKAAGEARPLDDAADDKAAAQGGAK